MTTLEKQQYDLGYRQRNAKAMLKLRTERRNRLMQIKNRPCADCQGWFNPWQMEFDHQNPTEKKYSVSQMAGFKLKSMWDEIKKCDIVCANCHADRTYKQLSNRAFKFGGQFYVKAL